MTVNTLPVDSNNKPADGLFDPVTGYVIAAKSGTISTTGSGVQYAPAIVNIADPTTPTNELAINNLGQIAISNFPGVQSVVGTVSVAQFPSNQIVSGTIDVTDRQARQLGVVSVSSGALGTNTAPGYTIIQDSSNNTRKLTINSDGSINVSGTISASNPSVGTIGSAIPTSADTLGASDGTNLQALLVESSANKNLRVGIYNGANEAFVTGSNALKVDNSAVTQPISGSITAVQATGTNLHTVVDSGTISLPSGASTSVKQPALGTAGTASSDVITIQGIASMTAVKVDGSGVTQPVSGTISVNALPASSNTIGGVKLIDTGGTNVASISSGGALKVDNSAVTQTVSGTVTANIGTTNGLALDTSVNGVIVAQGSTTSGEKGPLVQGAVTTSSPSYTTAQTSPISLTTAGAIRVDASATTQPISGTITANAGSGNFTVAQATGSNLHVVLDSGSTVVTQATATNLNTIATIQAVTGTSLAADQTNSELRVSTYVKTTTAGDTALTLGQATMANSLPVTVSSNQSAIPAYLVDSAGTNKASVDSSGNQYIRGNFTEQGSLSAGSLNADLVASTDVSAYRSFSLQIVGTWSGTLTFQGCNDNINFTTINVGSTSNVQPTSSTSSNNVYYGECTYRYLRVRMTSYTSGTATGVLELYTQPTGVFNVNGSMSQSGTWTVQPGNTPNTTPWLESVHDGTNKANVLSATSVSNASTSQGALLTAGAFQEVSFTTTTAQAVASTDVSNYKWVSVHITSQGTNSTVAYQGSNDNVNWVSVSLCTVGSSSYSSSTTTSNIIMAGPVNFRYFRLNVTGISAGTTAGVIELYTQTAMTPAVGIGSNGSSITLSNSDLVVVSSGAYTTTQTQADQIQSSVRGVRVVLNVTSAGTGSITLTIQGKDTSSGLYYTLLAGSAVTTNSTNIYVVYPGLTPAANAIASDVLSKTWRILVTANNANSMTYSVGATTLI